MTRELLHKFTVGNDNKIVGSSTITGFLYNKLPLFILFQNLLHKQRNYINAPCSKLDACMLKLQLLRLLVKDQEVKKLMHQLD